MKDGRSGIAWLLGGMILLSTMDAVVKIVVGNGYDPVQIIAIRSLMIVPAMLVILYLRGEIHTIKSDKPIPLLLRGVLGFFAPYCFFKSLQTLPLADATVVFFSSTFMITALSIPILNERVGIHRWSAVVIGFIGVIIAMKPQGGGQITGYLLVLVAALTYSFLFLTGRRLAKTESITALVFSFNVMAGATALLLLPLVWKPMDLSTIGQLGVLSCLALSGHYAITTAFSRTQASILAPFEYSAIVWATLWGYLLWGDIPGNHVWLGCVVIVACGLYVVYRETRRTTPITATSSDVDPLP